MESYIEQVKEAIQKNHALALSCHCKVHYSGRAEAHLGYGDRIVLIKADNTVIVHQATGNNPVNYMKPGSHFSFEQEGKVLKIRADNQPLKEYMDLFIKKIYFCDSHKLEDTSNALVVGTEKDMSDMIYAKPKLLEEGFTPVSQEEQTDFGYVDVFGYDKDKNLCVVECKRYIGDFKAVDQLRRYVERVKESKGIEHVRGILACPKMTPNALKMLKDFGFSHIAIEPPKMYENHAKDQTNLIDY